jgi:outer membrane protein
MVENRAMTVKRRSKRTGFKQVSPSPYLMARPGLACGLVLALAIAAPAQSQTPAQPPVRTLQDALMAAYSNNPVLQSARATLRATDENVPAALAGWHPTVTLSGSAGPAFANQINTVNSPFGFPTTHPMTKENRAYVVGSATLTQPIYRGGRTTAATNKAENQVMSQRAKLLAQEEQTFSDTISAYVNVIAAEQLLNLNINNEQVLTRQLQATNDRFRVGEITRTDVAQAEAALAGAVATRETAEGNLQTARATYQHMVGELPGKLVEPQPLQLPTKTLEEAKALAKANNPSVIAALFQNASDKDNFDLQYANLMPQVALQATSTYSQNATAKYVTAEGTTVLATVSVPLYQGGSEYAAIRQARQSELSSRKQIDDARSTAVQQVITAWETYQATKSTISSDREAIRANEVALEGVQREALVGSRTTLDVLNAEQALLNSRTTLVQSLATLVTNSYTVAAAVGRLTARDLHLNVPYYNETAYYEAVRSRWIGTGDYATDQPGR